MVYMGLSIMLVWRPFAQTFKISGLISYLKLFGLNSFSPLKTSVLKPLVLYMLLTAFNFLILFSAIFQVQFADVKKMILD